MNITLGTLGAKIPTFTGKCIDVYNPSAKDICLEDIAHHLSNICRFTGSTKRLYSVAEHSLMVSYLVHPSNAKWALLHDAAEAYINDVVKPIKLTLPNYITLEIDLQRVICERFNLPVAMPIEVKEADLFALAREGEHFHDHGDFKGFWQAEFADFMYSIRDRSWHHDWNDYFYYHQPPNNIEVKDLFLDRAKELGIQ